MNAALRTSTILAVVLLAGCIIAGELAVHQHNAVPDYFSNLGPQITFNDWANKNLDPRTSNAEYDSIRRQYFEDRIAPRIDPVHKEKAWEEFKNVTARPDIPGRRKTLDDYSPALRWGALIASLFLLVQLVLWIWSNVLKPATSVATETGLYGLARRVLFGKKGQ